MIEFPRPTVVASRCLGFDACRYNGARLASPLLENLGRHARILTVCPEVEIGLGTPRAPIRILEGGRLFQPETGLDLTERMVAWREERLDGLPAVDGFVLKNRSPSCGIRDAKIHSEPVGGHVLGRGPGLFAEAVLDRFPDVAVEDEGRLTNWRIREHFLTRIFTFAAFRRLESRPSAGRLVAFHSELKLLLMALSQKEMRSLGRIVANHERRPLRELLPEYRQGLAAAFARMARYPSHVNVLMHALGYFKKKLSAKEKAHFLDALSAYREGRLPLSAVIAILRSWIVRFDEEYLARQRYLSPYPEDLVEITDSGKGTSR